LKKDNICGDTIQFTLGQMAVAHGARGSDFCVQPMFKRKSDSIKPGKTKPSTSRKPSILNKKAGIQSSRKHNEKENVIRICECIFTSASQSLIESLQLFNTGT